MKKKILILAGGFSREREISLKTAKGVFNQIKKKYNAKICEPNGNLIKNLRLFKPDVVFNAFDNMWVIDVISVELNVCKDDAAKHVNE